MKKRFNVIKESKFEKLTDSEMATVRGGICILCKKRERMLELGNETEETDRPLPIDEDDDFRF